MSVSVMLRDKGQELQTCKKELPVMDAIRLMNQKKIGALVVVDDLGQVEGIVTERDVLHIVDNHKGLPAYITVADIMTSRERLIIAGKNQSVEEIMETMTEKRIRHMPVIEEDRLIGIISIGDVVKFELKKVLVENESMKSYISGM